MIIFMTIKQLKFSYLNSFTYLQQQKKNTSTTNTTVMMKIMIFFVLVLAVASYEMEILDFIQQKNLDKI